MQYLSPGSHLDEDFHFPAVAPAAWAKRALWGLGAKMSIKPALWLHLLTLPGGAGRPTRQLQAGIAAPHSFEPSRVQGALILRETQALRGEVVWGKEPMKTSQSQTPPSWTPGMGQSRPQARPTRSGLPLHLHAAPCPLLSGSATLPLAVSPGYHVPSA